MSSYADHRERMREHLAQPDYGPEDLPMKEPIVGDWFRFKEPGTDIPCWVNGREETSNPIMVGMKAGSRVLFADRKEDGWRVLTREGVYMLHVNPDLLERV